MTRSRQFDVVRRGSRRTTSLLRGRNSGAGRLVAALIAVLVGAGLFGAPGPAHAAARSTLSPAQVRRQEWWITRLSVDKAWRISRGAGVTVALLDSGVDAHFGDLRGAVRRGFVPGGSGDGRTDTDPGIHGTRLADEIAGRGTGFGLMGIAPRAKILPVVIPDQGFEKPTVTALNRLAAMRHPPAVANMSYGAAQACPAAVQAAALRAVSRGIILVASAGNSGSSTNIGEYPANCTGVIAVGAVNTNGTVWSDSQRQPYVMLGAPGVHLICADPQAGSGYGYATGTSDSAAIVSGIFAVARAHFPELSPRQLVTRVFATTHQFIGRQGSRNEEMGFGVALPFNALTEKVPDGSPNPVYAAVSRAQQRGDSGSSAPPTSASSSAASGSVAPAGGTHTVAQAGSSSTGGNGALIGALAGAVVVVGLVLTLLLRGRRRAGATGRDD